MALAQLIAQAEGANSIDALGYAGDVLPSDAWAALSDDTSATLIDVRSQPEWQFVGLPSMSSIKKEVLPISWRIYPEMELNDNFFAELDARKVDKQTPLFLLCRTGARSREAAIAATAKGYTHCFNIAHGFEGDAGNDAQRGSVNGWKAEGLPWQQM